MSGLVEQFSVASDTREQLVNAIKILLVWNKSVSHFKTGKDVHGCPYLTFQWHESGKGQPLIAPLQDASAIVDQVYAWFKSVGYNHEQPDTDGTAIQGWLVELQSPKLTGLDYETRSCFYDVFTVYPYWVCYHK